MNGLRFRFCAAASSFSLLLCLGCHEEPVGIERVQTVPVTGQVLIDGKPVHYAAVLASRTDGEPTAAIVSSTAYTDRDGTFAISTYEKGDGAPPGDYKLTFVWGEFNMMRGTYGGDKLNGKYADPDKSKVSISVPQSGEPVDVGTIELTTKSSMN